MIKINRKFPQIVAFGSWAVLLGIFMIPVCTYLENILTLVTDEANSALLGLALTLGIVIFFYAVILVFAVLLWFLIKFALGRCFRCDVFGELASHSRHYPVGYCIVPQGQGERLRENVPLYKKAYTVCIPFTRDDIDREAYRMRCVCRSAYDEIAKSYMLPDGISYMQPLISLKTATKLQDELCENEVAYLVYRCDFPRISRIDRNSEIVVIK